MMRVALVAVVLTALSCRKYPENNLVSFRSEEERLYRRWHLTGALGTFNSNSEIYYTFSKGKVHVENPQGNSSHDVNLNDRKTIMTVSGLTYRITKLTKRQLHFYLITDTDITYRFEAAD